MEGLMIIAEILKNIWLGVGIAAAAILLLALAAALILWLVVMANDFIVDPVIVRWKKDTHIPPPQEMASNQEPKETPQKTSRLLGCNKQPGMAQ
jgi:hypothetical protein